jgi:eukaryotic-like serine/threonine-protein kinase
MTARLTCPHGHQWESVDDLQATVAGKIVICPVCGQAMPVGQETVDILPGPSEDLVATRMADGLAELIEASQIDTDPAGATRPAAGTSPVKTASIPPIELKSEASMPKVGTQADPSHSNLSGGQHVASAEDLSQTVAFASRDEDDASAGARPRLSATGQASIPIPAPAGKKQAKTVARARPMPTVPGYEIHGELGRGGMGVVYRAKHLGLNRQVALKMILAGSHASVQELGRFRAEAEAVAQLQHPNIVQVYDIGEHEGCPFFSLEFIDGGCLTDRIANTPQPPAEAARITQVLAVAMEYAHQRGILHRDLKPANILLALDGTPKITDFGLAKRLEGDSSHTRTGSIIGTPSYMAPEQAFGQNKEIGPGADIYALGAILYELLTGRPPFQGTTLLETVQMVRTADPVPPSRLQPRLPRDLETICLTCLRKEPHKRYATSSFLAEDLRRFLAKEPIQARPAPAWERVAKWSRRRPAVAALIVVSSLAAVTVMVGGWLFARQEARRAEEARQLTALAQSNEKLAVERRIEAEREHARAEKNFQQALAAVDVMLTRVGEKRLAHEPRMERLRRDVLEQALHFYQGFLNAAEKDPTVRSETARAYRRVGDIEDMLGDYPTSEKSYRSAIKLLQELAVKTPDDADLRAELAAAENQLGIVLEATGQSREAQGLLQDAIEIRSKLVADFPAIAAYRRGLAGNLHNQGLFFQTGNKPKEADLAYGKAAQLFGELAAEFPKEADYRLELARTLANRAALLESAGNPPDAEKAAQHAVELQRQLVNEAPGNEDYRKELGRGCANLAVLFQRQGRWREAEAAYREANDTFGKLANDFPQVPDYRHEMATNANNLVELFQARKGWADADREARRAQDLLSRLVAAFPEAPLHQQELARCLDRHGMVLAFMKRPADAEKSWQQAIALQDDLVARYPDQPTYRQELARSHENLGILLSGLNRLNDAERNYQTAIGIIEALATQHPQTDSYRTEVVLYRGNLASLLMALGRWQEAQKSWQQLASLQRQQLAHSDSISSRVGLGQTLKTLAQLAADRHQLADAQRSLEEAIRHQRAAVEAAPGSAAYRKDLARYYFALMDVVLQQGDHAEAAKLEQELQEVAMPQLPELPRLAALLSKCIKLAGDDTRVSPEKREELAASYGRRAVDLLRQAVRAGYQDVAYLENSKELEPLRSREDCKKSLGEMTAGLRTPSP